jgi:pimeloyl-ACP methyl ester carboxylesterase
MQDAPFIIDSVPMTSSAAVNPELEAYRSYLKSGEIFNPIYGPAITRSLLDETYYKEWRDQVDSITKQFDLNVDRKSEMVEGYTVFSRAAEGFVWDLKKTSAQTRRIFIFARNDSALLLKDQLSVFLKVLASTPNALAFLVNDSGHVVPTEQPQAYANILTYLVSADIKTVSGIFEVQPGTDKPKFYQGAEAKKYISDLINSL